MNVLEYMAQKSERGIWGVVDPTGHWIFFYPYDLDGELAELCARKHADEKTFELGFMAKYFGVSPRQYVDAMAECRNVLDARVAAGAL
jgi:hypothetical protein